MKQCWMHCCAMGADVRLNTKSGPTPLHLAVQNTGRSAQGKQLCYFRAIIVDDRPNKGHYARTLSRLALFGIRGTYHPTPPQQSSPPAACGKGSRSTSPLAEVTAIVFFVWL